MERALPTTLADADAASAPTLLPRGPDRLTPKTGRRSWVHLARYAAHGHSAGVSLVLLPFTAAHGGQMRDFALAASGRGCDVLTLDYPGHGRSSGARGVFTVPGLFQAVATAVKAARRHRPDQPVVLAGSSWGGDLGLLYLLWQAEDPQRRPPVQAVVAQAVITPWQRPIFRGFRLGLALAMQSTGFALKFARGLFGECMPVSSMFRLSSLYIDRRLRKRFCADPLRIRRYDTESYFRYLTYLPPLPPAPIAVPVLVLIGDRDRLVPADYQVSVFEGLRRHFAAATMRILRGAGHAPFEAQIDQTADALLGWLARVKVVGRRSP